MSITKNFATEGNFMFRVNLIPGLAPYPEIFTHYRINHIKLRFIPTTVDMQVEDNDVGASTNIAKQTPLIYVKRLYGNENASGAYANLGYRAHAGHRAHDGHDRHRAHWLFFLGKQF